MEQTVSEGATACGSCCVSKEISTMYKGKNIYFCEVACKEEFLEDPEAFIKSNHWAVKLEITQ